MHNNYKCMYMRADLWRWEPILHKGNYKRRLQNKQTKYGLYTFSDRLLFFLDKNSWTPVEYLIRLFFGGVEWGCIDHYNSVPPSPTCVWAWQKYTHEFTHTGTHHTCPSLPWNVLDGCPMPGWLSLCDETDIYNDHRPWSV